MKCSYTEVFAIASVNKTWVVLTPAMHIGRRRRWTRTCLKKTTPGKEGWSKQALEQQMKQDSNGTTEEHVSMKILTMQRNRLYVEIDKGWYWSNHSTRKFQKQLFPMALRLPKTRPNLGETGKNRVKPLHFLTRGRVVGVRSKKNSYSHA